MVSRIPNISAYLKRIGATDSENTFSRRIGEYVLSEVPSSSRSRITGALTSITSFGFLLDLFQLAMCGFLAFWGCVVL